MNPSVKGTTRPADSPDALRSAAGQAWAIVLAGGEGVRLRSLVQKFFGDDRPKQFVPLMGEASLFRQTLQRIALLIPLERIVVVTQAHHAGYISRDLADLPGSPCVLFQPADRGTGTAVLFAAHWIHQRDPHATIGVFPADHFIRDEAIFMAHTAELIAFVRRHPERLVLLGARATEPDPDYGWIKPGERLGESADGPIYRVHSFWEKPSLGLARACLAGDWLWNTFVFVTPLPTLLYLGRTMLPNIDERLARIGAFAGTEHEAWAIRQAFGLVPTWDFSRSVLQECPPCLAVSKLPPIAWSDLGTPKRVLQVVGGLPTRPAWVNSVRRAASALTSPGSTAEALTG
ncbi:MAG TPA: sugar phosphate nucleotidyltransferase [Methylomirabilota bacterium]|nr:sugar phosphate nucleotidyltransferase [Methylomirabilota bacterium]